MTMRAGGIDQKMPFQIAFLQQFRENAFGSRRAADIAHADKENFYFFHSFTD
jgi:hypothetical protein